MTGSLSDLERLDFTKLLADKRSPLADVRDRALARSARFVPVTVEERLASFVKIGYHPHGLFVPEDPEAKAELVNRIHMVGSIEHPNARMRAYFSLQDETELWERAGVPGKWTGQQAISRSPAAFRVAGMGRRAGKSFAASREVVGLILTRPGSSVWIAAPTMDLVSRVFDMVLALLADLGIEPARCRNSAQEKLIILLNGARVEGVSLDRPGSAAGAAVDFVVVDEAAQVEEEAFIHDILPPLTDRNGQALLISSWEGEEGFFYEQARKAMETGDEDWSVFTAPSWENFFEFPQGRKSPKIVRQEKITPPLEFLEWYGAIPSRRRGLVFPEFKEKVHVGGFLFNPEHPVKLAVDPSGGANPYAVLVLQDYGDLVIQIDEFYEPLVIAENVVAKLRTRPWWGKVTDVVMDSASPPEIWRWGAMGCPAYPVPEKPQIWQRLPYVRRLLRNPTRFHEFYRGKVNAILDQMGYQPDLDEELPPEKQRSLAIQVEESMSDQNLTEMDVEALRKCASFFVDRRCVNTIREFKNYSFGKERKTKDPSENPQDKWNDAMDALGYYTWTYKRDEAMNQQPVSYLAYKNLMDGADVSAEGINNENLARVAGVGWLGEVRDTFMPHRNPLEPKSYLKVLQGGKK